MAFSMSMVGSPAAASFAASRLPLKAGRSPAAVCVRASASGSSSNDVKIQQQQQQKQQNGTSSSIQQQQQQQPQQQRSVGRSSQALVSPFDLWDPFMPASRSFGQMLDLMNQMMDMTVAPTSSAATGAAGAGAPQQRKSTRGVGRSAWDVMEDEQAFKMRIDMPGLTKEEVTVTVDDNKVLVIKGETSSERKEKDQWVARSAGSYESRIVVPENVEIEQIQAELKDGVLYVTVPKKKVEPKKQISVQVS